MNSEKILIIVGLGFFVVGLASLYEPKLDMALSMGYFVLSFYAFFKYVRYNR
ncbi:MULTISPECIES: hypothetical protein [Halomicrobium]|nr:MULTISPECIES: hypothetical protein [Halomicrobium]